MIFNFRLRPQVTLASPGEKLSAQLTDVECGQKDHDTVDASGFLVGKILTSLDFLPYSTVSPEFLIRLKICTLHILIHLPPGGRQGGYAAIIATRLNLLQGSVLGQNGFGVGCPLGIQLGGQFRVGDGQHLDRKQSGIDSPIHCDRCHGDTGGHLYSR